MKLKHFVLTQLLWPLYHYVNRMTKQMNRAKDYHVRQCCTWCRRTSCRLPRKKESMTAAHP